jgi:hypothetical protein
VFVCRTHFTLSIAGEARGKVMSQTSVGSGDQQWLLLKQLASELHTIVGYPGMERLTMSWRLRFPAFEVGLLIISNDV